MKACRKCGVEKPPDGFPAKGRVCRACVSARAIAWAKANPERAAANKKRWAERNPEYPAAKYAKNREQELERQRQRRLTDAEFREGQKLYLRAWYAAHREEQIAQHRVYREARRAELSAKAVEWARKNPEARRRIALADAQRRRGVPLDAEAREYADILARDPCCYCGGASGEVDHIVAVTRGGDSRFDNLTAACRSCNAQKHNASLLSFLAS